MKNRNSERVNIARRKRQFAAFLLAFIMAFMNFGTVLAWAASADIRAKDQYTPADDISNNKIVGEGEYIYFNIDKLTRITYKDRNGIILGEQVTTFSANPYQVDKYSDRYQAGMAPDEDKFAGWQIKSLDPDYNNGGSGGYINELELKAVSKDETYTVTFDTESDGKVTPPEKQIVKNDERPLPIDLLEWDDDHKFIGWFYEGNGKKYGEQCGYFNVEKYCFDDFIVENKDVTLHAKWKYKVRYYWNKNCEGEDELIHNDELVEYGVPARLGGADDPYDDPNWPGHDFLGWYGEKEKGDQYFVKGREDCPEIIDITNIYAHWTYNVKFDSDGGTEVKPDSQKINQGEKVEKPADPKKEGFTFKGWYLDDREYDFNTPVTTDITLKAKWEKPEDPEKKDPKKKDTQGDGDLYVPFDETGKLFQVAIVKRTDTSLKLSWNKVPGADRYVIYGRPCFHSPLLKIAEIKDPDTLTYVQTGLIKDKYYKYQLRAYSGNKLLAKTLTVHGTTLSDKNTVAGKIEISNVVGGTMEKTSASGKTASLYSASANSASANSIEMGTVRLKKKEKIKITAKEVPEESGKTIDRHRPRHNGKEKRQIEYQSTDKKVAKVTKTGLIKARNTGECVVFANAQNGVLYRIRVIVE